MTIDRLSELLKSRVEESRTLDYKQSLPMGSGDDKFEFLKDVSAMANTNGGHIVFGVEEERDSQGKPTGIPKEVKGIECSNQDAWKLAAQNWLNDCCEPKLFGVDLNFLTLSENKTVLVCFVEKSWSAPHGVTRNQRRSYHCRTASATANMSTMELKNMIMQSATALDTMQRFCSDRLTKVQDGNAQIGLSEGAKLVCHFLPLNAFIGQSHVDVRSLRGKQCYIKDDVFYEDRFNLEGLLKAVPHIDAAVHSYMQYFRDGTIEMVYRVGNHEARLVDGLSIEQAVVDFVRHALELRDNTTQSVPYYLATAIMKGSGYRIVRRAGGGFYDDVEPLRSDVVRIPIHEIGAKDRNRQGIREALTIPFDILWQAGSYQESPYQFDMEEVPGTLVWRD